jgi:hypothetical protein
VWDRRYGTAAEWVSPVPHRPITTATTTPPQPNEVAIYVKGFARVPKWFEVAREALNVLSALPANWNSYAAKELDVAAVTGAVQLLVGVMSENTPLPTFVPVPNGGVLLEWHTHTVDLEVSVLPSGRMHVFCERAGQDPIEFEGLPQEKIGQLKGLIQGI